MKAQKLNSGHALEALSTSELIQIDGGHVQSLPSTKATTLTIVPEGPGKMGIIPNDKFMFGRNFKQITKGRT